MADSGGPINTLRFAWNGRDLMLALFFCEEGETRTPEVVLQEKCRKSWGFFDSQLAAVDASASCAARALSSRHARLLL